jgi:DNA topoisomerase-1
VAEILPHKEALDPKYAFLLKAPVKDHEGNPSIVRYSRKTKEQYVMSEVEKKASGWRAMYVSGKWVEDVPVKKSAKKVVKKPAKKVPKKTASAKK